MKQQSANPHRKLPVDDPLLTAAEVADMLNTTENWVKDRGHLPSVKLGKLVRYRRSAVLAYIEQNTRPAQ